MAQPTVLIVGTCDTKLEEIVFLRNQIRATGTCLTQILDVSHTPPRRAPETEIVDEILAPLQAAEQSATFKALSRNDYIDKAVERCLPVVKELVSQSKIHGIVAAAGSSGSSLASALMRNACPIGFPKLLVSTMASGDIKNYVEESDLTMMYSVLDIAGLNSVLKNILSNAAAAIAGMAVNYAKPKPASAETKSPSSLDVGKRIAISMFGNTTPCVDAMRSLLTTTPHDVSEYEIYTFHATGAGGRSMERLIAEGQIDGVIDLTTTEIADELVGGVLTAGPHRLEAAAKRGIPTVVSVGACDMVNFGSPDTVPAKFSDRKFHQHNPAVTLMRTTKEENESIGKHIASQLKTHSANPKNIKVLLPSGGVSLLSVPNQPFYDQEADQALFDAIRSGLAGSGIEVIQLPEHLNDEAFAGQCVRQLLEAMGVDPRKLRLSNQRRRKWSFDHGHTVMGRRGSILAD